MNAVTPPNRDADRAAALRAALERHRAGDLAAAEEGYRRMLARDAADADALHMLGMLFHQRGESLEALVLLDRALEARPEAADILANRSAVLLAVGRIASAEDDAARAVALDERSFGGWFNLGLARLGRECPAEAARALRRASALRPQHAGALLQWFAAAAESGQAAGIGARLREPLPSLRHERAFALDCARALGRAGQSNAAAAVLARLRADFPLDASIAAAFDVEMHYRRACELEAHRRSDEALRTAAEVLAREPAHRGARLLRAELLRERGDVSAALDEHAALEAAGAADAVAASSRLITLQHSPDATADEIFAAHVAWAARYADCAPPWRPEPPFADPERPLRVGWMSSRFSSGVVGTFFLAAFQALDRRRLEHVLYDSGGVDDEVQARFRATASGWRAIDDLEDGALCELIRSDRIDVLVDLCGHSPGNRLRALAARPAPVQLSWLDYFHSTGLAAIDAFVSDRRLSPPEHAHRYVERLLHLPSGRLCYAPPVRWPEPGPRTDGPLRFASFNRLSKLNDAVLAAWSTILAAHPDAVLRLGASAFDDAQMRRHFLRRCESHGIDAQRLELAGYGTHQDVLAAYRDVDVALDPFPFTGCATSCDALAMGVPVVTWKGATMVARQTAALLEAVDLSDLVAGGIPDYVRCAARIAADAARRERLRGELPGRVRSRLGDVERHARELSHVLRQAWRLWCEGRLGAR
jgi:predicted O-linked N-acetylglucosamine transferase (SPINDLY family)